MAPTRVLIGFAEAMSAPEVAWSLVDAGFEVFAFARKGRASALRYSRHAVCHEICAPESDVQESLSDLDTLVTTLDSQASNGQLVLFPLDDKAVWLCSKLEVRGRWRMAGPSGRCADLALRKDLQAEVAREAGFNVPKTKLTRTAKDLITFTESGSYPIILKAAECVPVFQGRVYSCQKWVCGSHAERDRAIDQWQQHVPLLAQSFVTGVGEGLFGLAAPEGVRAWSGHHRVRMMNPQGSGSSACASQSVTEDLKSLGQKFISNSTWRGLFMIELLRDDEGRAWFVELNGRPWGSMALSRRQGLEYPAWHVKLALDESSRAGMDATVQQKIVCRNAGREFMHMLFVLKGPKSKALNRWPSFWKTLTEMLRIRRIDGVYNWRRDDARVFLADFYYTVHNNLFKPRD